jgi:hypothetical protein
MGRIALAPSLGSFTVFQGIYWRNTTPKLVAIRIEGYGFHGYTRAGILVSG